MSTLRAGQISVSLGKKEVLSSIDAVFESGQVTGLIGANGAGKTTLLRVLAGLLEPMQGTVWLDADPIVQGRELARRLAYLEQRPSSQWGLSAGEVVMLGRLPHIPWGRKPQASDERAVEQALRDTDALALRGRSVHRLSGGEQARVFMARALAAQPQWLLADEPVAGLDPSQQLRAMGLLRRKAGEGMGVIVSLHDLTLARRFCDRLLLLHQGGVHAFDSPEAVLSDAYLAGTFGLIVHRGRFNEESYLVPWEPLSWE